MGSQVYCPRCRRLQVPQITHDGLVCPDCDAILSPPLARAARTPEEGRIGMGSALDEPQAPSRPSGAMTLLRNDLRSEENNKQNGWLENILPRRPKLPTLEPEPAPPLPAPESPSRPSRVAPGSSKNPEPAPKSERRTAERPSAPAPPRRPSPAPTPREPALAEGISIPGVATFVIYSAIAGYSLLHGREAWVNVTYLATIFVLGISILGVLQRHQDRKAFWQGFSLFGWGYLVLAFVPWITLQSGRELPTSQLLVDLHARVIDSGPSFIAPGNLEQFMAVGHCIFALLAALLGSAISRWFHRTGPAPAC